MKPMKKSSALLWMLHIMLLVCCAALLPSILRMQPGIEAPPGEMHFVIIAPTQNSQESEARKTAEAFAAQYHVDVEFHAFSTVSEQKQMLRVLPDIQVDGVMLWPVSSDDLDYQDELSALNEAGIPVVVVERDVGQEFRQSFVASGTSSALLVLEQNLKSLGPEDTLMIGSLSSNGQNQTAELILFGRGQAGQVAPEEVIDKKLRQLVLTPPEGYLAVDRLCLEGREVQSLNLKYTLINLISAPDAPALFFSLDNTLTGTVISAKKSAALVSGGDLKLLCFGTLSQYQDNLGRGVLDGLMTSRPEVSVQVGLRYLRDLARGFWVPAAMDSGIDFWTSDQL